MFTRIFRSISNKSIHRTPDHERHQSPLLQHLRGKARVSAIVIDIDTPTKEPISAMPHIENLIRQNIRIGFKSSVYENMPSLNIFNPNFIVKVSNDATSIKEGLDLSCWTVAVINDLSVSESELSNLRGAHYQIKSLAELLPVIIDINERLQLGEFPISSAAPLFSKPCLPNPIHTSLDSPDEHTQLVTLR